jgi:multiple sugar transport system substrate-binding protein
MKAARRALIGAAALLMAAALSARAETMRMVVSEYGAGTRPYFEQMAAQFHAANPGIDVRIEAVPWTSLLQKLQTDIAGGSNADLSIIGTRWLLDFVRDDIAEPLDSYMTPQFRDGFIGQFLTPGQVQGTTYGLPIAASTRALYYNRTLLAKVGMPDGPTSWDDVVQVSEKLKPLSIPGFGIQGKGNEVDVYFYYALWSFGGDVVDANAKAVFDSPAGVRALTLYKSMIDRGLTEDGVTNYANTDIQAMFKQGRMGMLMTGTSLINQIAREAPSLDYGIVPVPKGTTLATFGVTDSVIMFKNSKVKPAAWRFLEFLFTKDARVAFNKSQSFLPTTKEEARDPYFIENERMKPFLALEPLAHFVPTVQGWSNTEKAVTDALQAAYLGNATPEAALKAAAQKANLALGK